MPIDFTQISSGEEFELLCEDLLRAMGFTIEAKVARGPDLGKDIIATKTFTDDVGFDDTHRYLVECKHFAKGGYSVREADIGSPIARMGTHNCDRYILVTTTVAAEKTRVQLAGITTTVPHYKATVWHKGDLTRLLDRHPDVRDRYFPLEPAPSTPAGELAETVEGLLTVKGFACQSRESVEDRVRLICTSTRSSRKPKDSSVPSSELEGLGVWISTMRRSSRRRHDIARCTRACSQFPVWSGDTNTSTRSGRRLCSRTTLTAPAISFPSSATHQASRRLSNHRSRARCQSGR